MCCECYLPRECWAAPHGDPLTFCAVFRVPVIRGCVLRGETPCLGMTILVPPCSMTVFRFRVLSRVVLLGDARGREGEGSGAKIWRNYCRSLNLHPITVGKNNCDVNT